MLRMHPLPSKQPVPIDNLSMFERVVCGCVQNGQLRFGSGSLPCDRRKNIVKGIPQSNCAPQGRTRPTGRFLPGNAQALRRFIGDYPGFFSPA